MEEERSIEEKGGRGRERDSGTETENGELGRGKRHDSTRERTEDEG